jgi:hypothetical protein
MTVCLFPYSRTWTRLLTASLLTGTFICVSWEQREVTSRLTSFRQPRVRNKGSNSVNSSLSSTGLKVSEVLTPHTAEQTRNLEATSRLPSHGK